MIAFWVGVPSVDLRHRVLSLVIRFDALQVTDWLWRIRLHPGVTHGKVEPTIGAPVQPVHTVAKVVETGVDDLILVGDIVPIGIAQHSQFRGVGYPQFIAFPSHCLYAVEPLGESLHCLGDPVIIRIDENLDIISR